MDPLLAAMRAEPFFAAAPPKSTGRDLFNASWLDAHLAAFASARVEDVQATLAELTASACSDAILRHAFGAREVLVCGGGALNDGLMRSIAAHLPGVPVSDTGRRGLPASQVEASAFAWLARAFLNHEPGNLVSVTGARGPRILGALYPA
jgi:anhydro-N-acetylmuramic acid kinase